MDVGFEGTEKVDEEGHGGYAIHVVIAIDADSLSDSDGGRQARYSRFHAEELHRVVQVCQGRDEETPGSHGLGDPAGREQPGNQGGEATLSSEAGDGVRIHLP